MVAEIKIEGLQDLEKQLKKLEIATAVKALNGALMSAAKPTYDRARSNAAFSDNFKNAIKRRKHRQIKKKTGKMTLQKGFRRAASGSDRVAGVSVVVIHKRAPHFHLLELGTDERTTKSGARRGRVEAREMMTKSFEGGAPDEAVAIFKKRMRSRLKRITKKGNL